MLQANQIGLYLKNRSLRIGLIFCMLAQIYERKRLIVLFRLGGARFGRGQMLTVNQIARVLNWLYFKNELKNGQIFCMFAQFFENKSLIVSLK